MPRPKGSKNKKTLEKLATQATEQVASSVSSQTEPSVKAKVAKQKKTTASALAASIPDKKDDIIKSNAQVAQLKKDLPDPPPDIPENAKHIISICQAIYNNLLPKQQARWDAGTGNEAPHFASPAHKMASVIIMWFDMGVSKEETLKMFTPGNKSKTNAPTISS